MAAAGIIKDSFVRAATIGSLGQLRGRKGRALKFDFGDGEGPVPAHRHTRGGGWVANTATVDPEAWIGPDALVYGNARVCSVEPQTDDAQIYENARVHGEARVYGNARIYGKAKVYGRARVYGKAHVCQFARIYGNARVYGQAWTTRKVWWPVGSVLGCVVICGAARVHGSAKVYEQAYIDWDARIYDSAEVYGRARITSNARVYESAEVYGSAGIYGNARVYGDAEVFGEASVSGNAEISGTALVCGGQIYGVTQIRENARIESDRDVTEYIIKQIEHDMECDRQQRLTE
jgi:carbonic anhydrase/acetyltransferase-like protein (isoleucine patch superfamily)